ncbi:hypothetical protein QYS48_31630 [Marivirga arenosa]|uniref:Uncharacterized protein n=1 Tax=Marivirga arenosa TaxID=3059076 RepID=A0AA51R802_9BACT|nr:hypothetical protein [Marivirga sp. ABR2-2]WMN06111.1 hypothetical protein QYS48_31630 [Marivirga sp. ABR2-2]
MRKSILLFIAFAFISCSPTTDEADITFSDFDSPQEVELIPYEDKTYVSWAIQAKGYVNDSIKIKRDGYYDIVLTGTIDTLINGDYYGKKVVKYTIDPYRAKNGSIELSFSL